MNRFRDILIYFILLTSNHSYMQEKWSLEACIDYVLEHNLALNNLEYAIDSNKEVHKQSYLNLLPSISGNSNYAIQFGRSIDPNNNSIVSTDFFSNRYSLNASLDIFRGFQKNDIIILQTKQDEKLRNTTLQELDADLARMRKTLSMIFERIDQLNVRAASDGQLGFLDAEIGQNISQGQRIGQINVLTDFKIEAEIGEHYIDRIKRDLNATLERNNTEYRLRLRKVYPEVRNGRFKIDLVFISEKPKTIRTGQSYNINLQLGASNNALLLSKGGFFQITGGQYVFVLDEIGEKAYKRSIKIGKQNPNYFEVIEGLEIGESVITSNYSGFGNADVLHFKE